MERQSMSREIEADGYITRESDITPMKRTCFNCKCYVFDIVQRRYKCKCGHNVGGADWREKYEVCDKWEGASE